MEYNGEWTQSRLLAWTLAHELGHAIGLDHTYSATSVMMPELHPDNHTWADAMRFTENTSGTYYANLTFLLGRENIYGKWW
jgi:hypothetical protein